MKKHYLIDFENVSDDGLKGYFELSPEDTVEIFYTENAARIGIEFFENCLAAQGRAGLRFIKVPAGKQSLDMQLATYLGALLAGDGAPDAEYCIVSKDKGFASIRQFWQSRRPGAVIRLQRMIRPTDSRRTVRSRSRQSRRTVRSRSRQSRRTRGSRSPLSRRRRVRRNSPKHRTKLSRSLSVRRTARSRNPRSRKTLRSPPTRRTPRSPKRMPPIPQGQGSRRRFRRAASTNLSPTRSGRSPSLSAAPRLRFATSIRGS